MAHMTRIERVREHLRVFGPMTTKQISNVFNWPISTASSVISQAAAYGFVATTGIIPPADPTIGGKGQHIWAVAAPRPLKYPAAHGETSIRRSKVAAS